ncbi:hypothetical protein CDD82_3800 [Ophiocordyceps australis]|uniref:AB hydrolase-1 domain-containing protein n=1 Tax=Ophiocordyceps australis TaxID=1399860 RepID=A0A2C5ZUN7_9HYPO|nr:hypothetical protein CDD82_3800 [Ophiocordyceps australis]
MLQLSYFFAVLTALLSPRAVATTNSPFVVTVHPYGSAWTNYAYEYGETASDNAVIFINGLFGGPHTSPFVRRVAEKIHEAQHVSFSVFDIRLRSAFTGFGMSSLSNDAADIAVLVEYLRSIGKRKIVLHGHSTGCQDCMEYANYNKHHHPSVDGFILQATVSDREFLETQADYQEKLDFANALIKEGKSNFCIPRDDPDEVAMSAYRVHSLYAKGGDDDYFSSDLSNKTVVDFWKRFQKPVMVLLSEKDEFVQVSKKDQLQRYQEANPEWVSPLSGLIPNATHSLWEDAAAHDWVAERVVAFLKTLC